MTTLLHVAAGHAYGGIERMLVACAGIRHPAVAQTFAVAFPGRLERELRAAGASVRRLPAPRASRPLRIWRARRELAAALAGLRRPLVICHGAWPHAMFAPAARRAGARLAFWQHHPIGRPGWPDRWARCVRPDFSLFNSRFTADGPLFPDTPGHVIHCPVAEPPALDAAARRALRAQLGAGEADLVVLMAARLEAWKGHDVLIEAAAMLAHTGVRVWIAGGVQRPSERAYAERLASRARAPELGGVVSLLGDREDVPTLMRLADVYCQPNREGEPFGIAIAEAMRAGLPCVVSARGGAAELVDASCGFMTATGDAAGLAASLQHLHADPVRRRRMGEAAVLRARRLTDVAGRLEELATVAAAHAA